MESNLPTFSKKRNDVIIVGTGMGGATLGHALARAGRSVLFCEWGNEASLAGSYPEQEPSFPSSSPLHQKILMRANRYAHYIRDITKKPTRSFIPFIGAGLGGSTALYGMVLERFTPEDFTPKKSHPDAKDSNLPEAWPIAYEELLPYYKAAEDLYRVTTDLPLDEGNKDLFQYLKEKNLAPYRLPLALDHPLSCKTCQGFVCDKKCKNDANKICLQPAIANYGAELLDKFEVTKILADEKRVYAIEGMHNGEYVRLEANIIVLACGALETARLLLRSKSDYWPQGLANSSGLVGKHLMRHAVDLMLLHPSRKVQIDKYRKVIGTRAFYNHPEKLGSIQSFGALPHVDVLYEGICDDVAHSSMWFLKPLLIFAAPLVKSILRMFSKNAIILALIVEDTPSLQNRVSLPEDGNENVRVDITYQLSSYDKGRVALFRKLAKQAFASYKTSLLKQAENNQRIAHACGTCRFGDDLRQSVLNRHNRTHDLSNLYVVDASFFPSSGGTNPSLTIAANALRVADHLLRESSNSIEKEKPNYET